MSLILILALQAAAAPASAAPSPSPSPSPPQIAFIDWDLGRVPTPEASVLCRAGSSEGEVLVCGRRHARAVDRPMMDYWDRIYAPRPIRAEMSLGENTTGRIYSEAVPMDRGAVSNRAMVGIRTPF